MATDWSKLTVVDLRAELKRRGLPQYGKKADLVERLAGADEATGVAEEANAVPEESGPAEIDAPVSTSDTARETEVDAPQTPLQSPDREKKSVPASPGSPAPALPASEATPSVPLPSLEETKAPHQTSPKHETPEEERGRSVDTPAVSDFEGDAQSRKRRSRTPPPPVEEEPRKRMRYESDKTVPNGPDFSGAATNMAHNESTPSSLEQVEPDKQLSHADTDEMHHRDTHQAESRDGEGTVINNETRSSDVQQRDVRDEPISESRDFDRVWTTEEGPASPATRGERPVAPAIHAATSALYIKNFMRPLRSQMVQDYLVDLATPPGQSRDYDVIVDFYLDQIRTHAFVNFRNVSAASRVRSALHDQVWPDEKNRKALWVDFIPPEKVREWSERERGDSDGRGNLNRWVVVYEPDSEGNMVASLEGLDADSARQTIQPPPGPRANPVIPTGPSRAYVGVEGAPLGPRASGGRPGGRFATHRAPPVENVGEGWQATKAKPSIIYRAAPEELVRRRIENMRSFYSTDRHRDMGREDEINRYTFEDGDSFVDRGKEVFIGIRPPHRERERWRRRGPSGGGPPPRSDRYFGGSGGGGGGGSSSSRRSDFPPRSRLDGAPLPTYNGDRWGRGGYRSYRP
ncbi:hypothetical protein VTK73DRAFT_8385 [Phialemonium thermophilum]|uniref:SAP domain-containing protein n=1 Tax=Phialemonium thermophilum TaxID=223376 RepID=A0ABR3XQH3_9PEZI